MALYDLLYARLNGNLLVENTEVDTEIASDISQVKTIPKGFSGITPGSPVRMASLKNAVPVAGFEYDWETAILESREVEFEFALGSGASVTTKGYILSAKVTSAVGKTTEIDISYVGTASAFA